MLKYRLADGTLINVPKDKLQKFLGENPGARLISSGKPISGTTPSIDSTMYRVGGEKYEVSKEKEEQFLTDFKDQQIVKISGTSEKISNIQHVSVEDWKDEVGDSWWTKEGNAAEFLNNHYRYNQGLDVMFKETKGGYNRLRMVVN